MPRRKPDPTIRLAVRLREQILGYRRGLGMELQRLAEELRRAARQLERAEGRLAISQQRGWQGAVERLQPEVAYLARDLRLHLETLDGLDRRPLPPVPQLLDLINELRQLRQEFGDWQYRHAERSLVVTTEPIVLQGVGLGPFEIRLELKRLGRAEREGAYRVIALEPNPASNNEAVTHPHVSDEHLCEGDSGAAIGASLAAGRICDFFLLVRSVLETYNSASPYVALGQWEGTPCGDCGYLMDQDASSYCEGCDRDFCDECISCCHRCVASLCHGCLSTCPECEESVCPDCMECCSGCEKICCKECQVEGLCPTCKQQQEEKENDHEDAAKPSTECAGRPGGA